MDGNCAKIITTQFPAQPCHLRNSFSQFTHTRPAQNKALRYVRFLSLSHSFTLTCGILASNNFLSCDTPNFIFYDMFRLQFHLIFTFTHLNRTWEGQIFQDLCRWQLIAARTIRIQLNFTKLLSKNNQKLYFRSTCRLSCSLVC